LRDWKKLIVSPQPFEKRLNQKQPLKKVAPNQRKLSEQSSALMVVYVLAQPFSKVGVWRNLFLKVVYILEWYPTEYLSFLIEIAQHKKRISSKK